MIDPLAAPPPPPRPAPRPGPIYAIADAGALGESALPAAVRRMAAAGIDWIQLRAKDIPDRRLYALAAACAEALAGSGASLWIDDRPDVALLVGAAGVHLGQHDLPPAAARIVVGEAMWIGRSTHGREEVAAAAADPAVDVVAVGPIFATASKADPEPVVGLELVRWARAATAKPLVAIGGIDAGNAAEVLAAGADAVAVLSAVCRGEIEANVLRLLAAAGREER